MIKICNLSEFSDNNIISKIVNSKNIALVKIKEQVFAFDDECTHEKYPLSHGMIDENNGNPILECSYHGTKFNLKSGKVVALPATKPLKIYKTEIKQGEVWVEL
ncbi:nitrite reductase (NAD(P)H) small subunit [Candidatus Pacearchaeota archaeon]|nr:nitrite reductase (NAD(P)H) small subunit [Candidatus Pacearchaeota archaeon]